MTRLIGSWPARLVSLANGPSSCRRGREIALPASRARSSRSRCWPNTWIACLTRCCGGVPASSTSHLPRLKARDTDPLDAPITEEFRVGTMTIAWDPSIDRIVIELFSNVDEDDDTAEEATSATAPSEPDEIDADEVFVVKITASYARDFVARAQALVAAGRPSCPFCLQPIDPHGHICPRANGYRPAAVRLNSAVTVDDLGANRRW